MSLPQFPDRSMPQDVFDPLADAAFAALPQFEADMNAASAAAVSAAATANAAAASATGVANYKGAWATLTGALAVPASVAHDGKVWLLLTSVADVTLHTPGVSGNWLQVHPLHPLNRATIFDPASAALIGASSGESIHNNAADPGIPADCVCGGGVAAIATDSVNVRSQLAQSATGDTWMLRTLPSSGRWLPLFDGTNFLAVRIGSGASTAIAMGGIDGVTWTSGGAPGGTIEASIGANRHAAGGGKAVVWLSTNAISVTTNSGSGWSAAQTPPSTAIDHLWVLDDGTTVGHITAGSTYYTSATALTGSWTTRTLPTGCDTMVQDFDRSLLAYKAGSVVTTVRRSTDGVTWTDTGVRLWRPDASIRSINGIYINGVAYGSQLATKHADWVPRNSLVSLTADRACASRAGVLLYLMCGNGLVTSQALVGGKTALFEV